MTREERRNDINERIGVAIAERNFQPKGSQAYNDLTKIIKDIRCEYQNGVKTRIIMRYDENTRRYYGVDIA